MEEVSREAFFVKIVYADPSRSIASNNMTLHSIRGSKAEAGNLYAGAQKRCGERRLSAILECNLPSAGCFIITVAIYEDLLNFFLNGHHAQTFREGASQSIILIW